MFVCFFVSIKLLVYSFFFLSKKEHIHFSTCVHCNFSRMLFFWPRVIIASADVRLKIFLCLFLNDIAYDISVPEYTGVSVIVSAAVSSFCWLSLASSVLHRERMS